MAGFFIERLVVTGRGKKPSTIEFSDGLNFIVGPSNTGKSYIVECIDYLFGFEPKKINHSVLIRTSDTITLSCSRKPLTERLSLNVD